MFVEARLVLARFILNVREKYKWFKKIKYPSKNFKK
jgi:hypothetical protein